MNHGLAGSIQPRLQHSRVPLLSLPMLQTTTIHAQRAAAQQLWQGLWQTWAEAQGFLVAPLLSCCEHPS